MAGEGRKDRGRCQEVKRDTGRGVEEGEVKG